MNILVFALVNSANPLYWLGLYRTVIMFARGNCDGYDSLPGGHKPAGTIFSPFDFGRVVGYIFGLLGLIYTYYLYKMKPKFIPKDAKNLFLCLLGGIPSGQIMVSYTHRENTMYETSCISRGSFVHKFIPRRTSTILAAEMMPRKIARLLPCRWLDEDFLVPGGNVSESCKNAAKACMFGILFISAEYLTSDACLKEFEALVNNNNDQPEKPNMFFIHEQVFDLFQDASKEQISDALKNILEERLNEKKSMLQELLDANLPKITQAVSNAKSKNTSFQVRLTDGKSGLIRLKCDETVELLKTDDKLKYLKNYVSNIKIDSAGRQTI